MRVFDVNNDEVIALTAKLEKVSKSAFPSAIRNTLNKAAFETKKQVPVSASKRFVTRQKTLFKRFTIVEKANGFDVNKMKSTVGINASMNRQLAKNLSAQEFGGMVKGKKLIPHDESRVSSSNAKRVRRQNTLEKINYHNATSAFKNHRGTRGSKFVAAVMSTAKSGKNYMMLKTGKTGIVYRVSSVSQNMATKKINFKVKKLYTVRGVSSHMARGVGFMSDSVRIVSKRIDDFYADNAEYQFKKAMKK